MNVLGEPELWIAMGAVCAGGVIRGFSGFGAAMLVVPILSILYLPHQAVAIAMCLALVANIQLVPGALRSTEWRQAWPLSIGALVGIPLGALALLNIDPDLMRRAISAIVLAFALLLLSGWRWRGRQGLRAALLTGSMAGVINGAAGTGGPPVILYLLAGPRSAETSRANIISVYLFLNGGTLASLAVNGVVTPEVMWRALLLAPAWVLSLWIGIRMFHTASDRIYRRIALLTLVGVGLFGLFFTR
ncbi:MAG: sulfite exporter TauE/SafE family protein [SAR324 cluster bacterium]|nr:sulfite exporter TauE/SafE family protein [SAR324 cluster bacterium]